MNDESVCAQEAKTTCAAQGSGSNNITPSSDLSDCNRRIWIVTTAGLPWMTGTAVNPLLRAVSLAAQPGRPKHYITLMIPWLVSSEERHTLYGEQHKFQSPTDQEKYIRQYCVDRCNCSMDVAYDKLQIKFWYGKYHESFGSIFPIEDICSTIPRAEADVCILEEPEHLNWFRVPAKKKVVQPAQQDDPVDDKKSKIMETTDENSVVSEEMDSSTDMSVSTTASTTGSTVAQDLIDTNNFLGSEICDDDIEKLGWAHKFRHVVGILHTNYADYIRQYGMASMVTAPALNALSSLVVKAYCHKVIRLSDTLPPLDVTKEVTCNVHGVRYEFLEPPVPTNDVPAANTESVVENVTNSEKSDSTVDVAPVYFIGKLIWAKGFERILELQERFKLTTGEYFPIDIYGGGKDQKEIQVAFFGRNGTPRSSSSLSNQDADGKTKFADEKAAAVFNTSESLRDQINVESTTMDDDYVIVPTSTETDMDEPSDNAFGTDNGIPGDVSPPSGTSIRELLNTPDVYEKSVPTESATSSCQADVNALHIDTFTSPIEVIGDLSGKTLTTTVDTADATLKLIDSALKAGFDVLGGGTKHNNHNNNNGNKTNQSDDVDILCFPKNHNNNPIQFHHIAPAKIRFKWRRNPVPARFLGVQDHIIIRDIEKHKVFLNMSTSEVLCTTTAEALAMGKFVVIPRHCSNTFFLDFPNCLSYETWDECLDQLQYALANIPTPLSETHRHALSWEGATERLIMVSAITHEELETRKAKGLDKADMKAAQFHIDAGAKSNWLRKNIILK